MKALCISGHWSVNSGCGTTEHGASVFGSSSGCSFELIYEELTIL